MNAKKILVSAGSLLFIIGAVYLAIRFQTNLRALGNSLQEDSIKLKDLFFQTIDFETGLWNGPKQ